MRRRLGLGNDWAYNIIKQVGNYGEIFERNVGLKTPLELARGLNALWSKGGLHLRAADPLRPTRRRPTTRAACRGRCTLGTPLAMSPRPRRSRAGRGGRAGSNATARPRGPLAAATTRASAAIVFQVLVAGCWSRCRRLHRQQHGRTTCSAPGHRLRLRLPAAPPPASTSACTLIAVQHRTSSYGRAFLVGLLNTLWSSSLGIVLATILGFIIGIAAAVAATGSCAKLAAVYVEIVRNIPLLLQLLFWYFARARRAAGACARAWRSSALLFLNNRGI